MEKQKQADEYPERSKLPQYFALFDDESEYDAGIKEKKAHFHKLVVFAV